MIAGLLGLRSDRAVGFPERQEIGELRLNFIRVSPNAGKLRYALIGFAPLIAGTVCLWATAAHIFRLQEAAILLQPGSVDELARAINRLTTTADFWLWFYLAFTVANTMFPRLCGPLSARQLSGLALVLTATAYFVWRIGGAIETSVAQGIEVLVSSLIIVVLQVIFINIVVVLGLGALEALFERLTGKSAAFADGKMITMSRQEAQNYTRLQARERLASRQRQPGRKRAEVIRSVYDLKLPIPGPPGREPVSRSVVSVVNLSENTAKASTYAETIPDEPAPTPRSTISVEQSAPVQPERSERKKAGIARTKNQDSSSTAHPPAAAIDRPLDDALAPFSRPFADASSSRHADDDVIVKGDKQASGEHFPRPFSMKTRSFDEADTANIPPTNSDPKSSGDGDRRDTELPVHASRTRPAPKPSSRAASEKSAAPLPGNGELAYEPLDDEDVFAENEDSYDDTPPSS